LGCYRHISAKVSHLTACIKLDDLVASEYGTVAVLNHLTTGTKLRMTGFLICIESVTRSVCTHGYNHDLTEAIIPVN
jgi:hypothetical protein